MTNYQKSKFSLKNSRWTQQESILYLRFLKRNVNKINDKNSKKFLKFKRMAQQIQTKTPSQCRSHHQKIMIRYKSIENLINGVIPESYTAQIKQITGQNKINSSQLTLSQQSVEKNQTKENQSKNKNNKYQEWKFEWESDENIFDVLYDDRL